MQKKLLKGFTLIELMIVVAIIGILAAIAIPNFLRFQARARQSEAKGALKAYYEAEKGYYANSGTFGPGGQAGWKMERNNRYSYYTLSTPTNTDNRTTSTEPANTASVTYDYYLTDTFKYTQPGMTAGTQAIACGGTLGVTSTGNTAEDPSIQAEAQAVGNVDNDATFDVWTVSTHSRTSTSSACNELPTGLNIGAGEPANDANDVDF